MEQSNITISVPDALKVAYFEGSDAKGIWGAKHQKKSKGKSFFQQLVSSLSAHALKNINTSTSTNNHDLKIESSASQVKKGAEEARKGLSMPDKLIVALEKKKIHEVKSVKNHENTLDAQEKSEKVKEPKKKVKNQPGEQATVSDHKTEQLPSNEKKIKTDTRQIGEREANNTQVKAQDHSDKSKRTIVIDLRKIEDANRKAENVNSGDGGAQQTDAAASLRSNSGKGGETAYFGSGFGGQSAQSKANGTDGKSSGFLSGDSIKTFQDILHNEIVTNTKFILGENGNGEIQIDLKPDSLGKLKFKVSLENNRIEGKIFVENNNVREMVEQSVANLSQALMEQGFDAVNLQVSLGGDNGNDADRNDSHGFRGSRSHEFEKTIPVLGNLDMEDRLVNVVI